MYLAEQNYIQRRGERLNHYGDVIMAVIASQITSLTIVYSTVNSGADQRKHQSSASLALCAGKSPVTGEFPAQRASNAENVSIWWRHHVVNGLSFKASWGRKANATIPKYHFIFSSWKSWWKFILVTGKWNCVHFPRNTIRSEYVTITSNVISTTKNCGKKCQNTQVTL